MSIRVLCPEGHPVCLAADKLGSVVFCPQCYTSFHAELADPTVHHARNDGPKSKRTREEDEDEEDDDDKPVQKKKTPKKDDDEKDDKPVQKKKTPKKDDDEEDEKPRKKPVKAKKDDDDEDEDEDDDEDDDDDVKEKAQEEEETIDWTKKKRALVIVNVGMMAYLVAFYVMIAAFIGLVVFELLFIVFLIIALVTSSPALLGLFMLLALILFSGSMAVMYICHLIGWITGLFAPGKSEGRSVAITALIMFLSPVVFYLIYLFFDWLIITRPEVSFRMLHMFNAFGFILIMMAFYCSLVYIGRIAGYLGLTMDKYKPQALGWFIVGGIILLVVSKIAEFILLALALAGVIFAIIGIFIVGGWIFNLFYFIITSMREMVGVVTRIRAAIDDHIKYG